MSAQPSTKSNFESFHGISRFLRMGFVDEESRDLRDSISLMAERIDALVQLRQAPVVEVIAQTAHEVLHAIELHRKTVADLGSVWKGLTELRIYQRTLARLQQAALAWQDSLEQQLPSEPDLFHQLEMQAWRTLGDAILVIDIYEQASAAVPATAQPSPQVKPSAPAAPPGVWQRLSAWWKRSS